MKKKLNTIINSIKYSDLEFFSYTSLIFWVIAPFIEFISKYYIHFGYRYYFVTSKYIIGFIGLIMYAIYIYKKKQEHKLDIHKFIPQILILILLIISLISSLCAKDIHLSFFGELYRKEGLIAYIMYIGFILSSSIITNEKYIKNLFNIIITSAIFITVLPLFRIDFTFHHFSNIYRQFNHYGYFLMISTSITGFMFIISKHIKKIIYLFFFIFLAYILTKNDTFGCYLALLISLLFSLVYCFIVKYKRLDIIILIIAFIFSSLIISRFDITLNKNITPNNSHIVSNNFTTLNKDIKTITSTDKSKNTNKVGTGRGILWKYAWKYTINHPLLGGGMECLKEYYKENNITDNDRPHNSILQISSFIGIPGAIIYILLILYLSISNLKHIKNNPTNIVTYVTAMCYFISSLFGNSMYYTSPYFMILLGLLISINYNSYQSYKKVNQIL